MAWVWCTPLLLALLQVWVTATEAPQVRYEELAEGVRNVFWLDHRLVFDGVSTNVAWYGFLLGVYRVFGFGLETASWARVALHAAALCALSVLLHRYLSRLGAVATLTMFAASPSLLFFNRLVTSYGTDIVVLPFCLLALDDFRRRSLEPARGRTWWLAFIVGALAMLAGMSYPSFLPAWPFLGWWLYRLSPPGRRRRYLAAGGAGFATPLVLALLALRQPLTLLWDPVERSGLFRGGGVGWIHDSGPFLQNVEVALRDLFVRGDSYYFHLHFVDLGGSWGAIGAGLVALLAVVAALRVPGSRPLLATGAGAALLTLFLVSLAGGPPGLRRALLVLAGLNLVVATLWYCRDGFALRPWSRAAATVALLVLPVHHLSVFPGQLHRARIVSWERDRTWFSVADSPSAALDHWLARVDAGQPLDCRALTLRRKMRCGYAEIYAAVAGWHLWNEGREVEVRAIDPRDGRVVTLSPYHWRQLAPPGLDTTGVAPAE